MIVTMQSRVTPAASVLFRELDGEAVLLELQTGKYYGLDEVGTRFWLTLQTLSSLEPALGALSSEFEVSEERLKTDLLEFVEQLAAKRLVEISEG